MTRDDAMALLREFTQSESLLKHALAVEAAMRGYARQYGEDEEQWAIVGLLHDFDYERYPTAADHPFRGAEILAERGYPEWVVRAILTHANYSGVTRDSMMEKTLFAVDELTGFVTAVALVRLETKSIMDVKPSSVRKKLEDRAFAAAVSREDIVSGAEALGVELDAHIDAVIRAMQTVADELGLAGTAAGDEG